VIAGATENSTREVVRISRVAMDLGVDAVLVAPPFYFKPSRDEIRAHYSAIAEKVEIPIFLYNVPKFTLVNIDVGIIETLVEEHSGIVGIKDSGGSVGQISEIIRKFGNHLDVFAGTADLLFPSLMLGAKGGIVAVANVAPRLCAQMYSAFLNKDYERAKKLHFLVNKLNEVLVKKYNQISAIKEAMGILGIEAGRARMPTLPLADAAVDEIRQVLEETGVKGQI
jgi:4-hydroxy-tetrahydrodipicolinate synthase